MDDWMDELVLIELLCAACRSIFHVCERDYRGHRYCQEMCRGRGQRQARRAANDRHQRSAEGRADHRDRNRALRKRKSAATSVTDMGSKEFDHVASLPTPERLPVAMEVAVQSEGEGKNDEAIQIDGVFDARPDAVVAPGRDGRDLESRAAVRAFPASPTRDDDVARRLVDVPLRQAARCCVCGCIGQFILPGFRGRAGRRGPQRVFRGRDRSAYTPSRAAN